MGKPLPLKALTVTFYNVILILRMKRRCISTPEDHMSLTSRYCRLALPAVPHFFRTGVQSVWKGDPINNHAFKQTNDFHRLNQCLWVIPVANWCACRVFYCRKVGVILFITLCFRIILIELAMNHTLDFQHPKLHNNSFDTALLVPVMSVGPLVEICTN